MSIVCVVGVRDKVRVRNHQRSAMCGTLVLRIHRLGALREAQKWSKVVRKVIKFLSQRAPPPPPSQNRPKK